MPSMGMNPVGYLDDALMSVNLVNVKEHFRI